MIFECQGDGQTAYQLDPALPDRLFCSNQEWIGQHPRCVAINRQQQPHFALTGNDRVLLMHPLIRASPASSPPPLSLSLSFFVASSPPRLSVARFLFNQPAPAQPKSVGSLQEIQTTTTKKSLASSTRWKMRFSSLQNTTRKFIGISSLHHINRTPMGGFISFFSFQCLFFFYIRLLLFYLRPPKSRNKRIEKEIGCRVRVFVVRCRWVLFNGPSYHSFEIVSTDDPALRGRQVLAIGRKNISVFLSFFFFVKEKKRRKQIQHQ